MESSLSRMLELKRYLIDIWQPKWQQDVFQFHDGYENSSVPKQVQDNAQLEKKISINPVSKQRDSNGRTHLPSW